MSERYVPPPPPYQPSVQHDQKVTEVVHTLEPSKTIPSRGEEWNDSKHHSADLADQTLRDAALHSISKHPAKLDGASFRIRGARPLPSRPVDSLGPQEHGRKLDPIAEIKSHGAQSAHSIRLRTAASMLFPAPSLGESTHLPTAPSPPHYPSQPYNTPHRKHDDRWAESAYPLADAVAESPFRRSTHTSVQSPPHGLSQKNGLGMRLSFDPSVAYAHSQANPQIPSTRREAAASLYTSAVSSHLPLDYATTYESRQYVSMRPAPRTARRDNTDRQSVWSMSSHPSDCMPSRTSVYSLRPKTSSGHEQRWATSETDVTRDIYRR